MFTYLLPETRVRKDHPLHALRAMMDECSTVVATVRHNVRKCSSTVGFVGEVFEGAVAADAVLDPQPAVEEIDYSMLCRWLVRLNLDEAVWDPTSFTKHRQNRSVSG